MHSFFYFNCVLSGFFFYRVFFFFFVICLMTWFVIKNYIDLFFSPSCVGTRAWNRLYIGGFSRALGSSTIFNRKGSISRTLWKMLLGLVVRQRRSSGWKQNVTVDGFRELPIDRVLIYEGAVVAILLHEFVPSDQVVEYFTTMAHMSEFGGRVTRTCSPETRMAMFGHKFCYNDCVPPRWTSKPWTYCSHIPGFFPRMNF